MHALDTWGRLRTVGDAAGSNGPGDRAARGQALGERFNALGISQVEFHARTGIAPATLTRVFAGDPKVRPQTIASVEAQLDRLERFTQTAGPVENDLGGGMVAITVEGVYGARTITVKGPVENLAELQRAVAELLRGARDADAEDS